MPAPHRLCACAGHCFGQVLRVVRELIGADPLVECRGGDGGEEPGDRQRDGHLDERERGVAAARRGSGDPPALDAVPARARRGGRARRADARAGPVEKFAPWRIAWLRGRSSSEGTPHPGDRNRTDGRVCWGRGIPRPQPWDDECLAAGVATSPCRTGFMTAIERNWRRRGRREIIASLHRRRHRMQRRRPRSGVTP